jgi:hypothetical protein
MEIIFLIYLAAGYWATGQTIYANKIIISSGNTFFFRRLTYGLVFGWILIPVALIKMILNR